MYSKDEIKEAIEVFEKTKEPEDVMMVPPKMWAFMRNLVNVK